MSVHVHLAIVDSPRQLLPAKSRLLAADVKKLVVNLVLATIVECTKVEYNYFMVTRLHGALEPVGMPTSATFECRLLAADG